MNEPQHTPNRQSAASLALICTETHDTHADRQISYLTQWNEGWTAFSLLGGHVGAGETFRDCLIRELTEELRIDAADMVVDSEAVARLRYNAFSRSARVMTRYEIHLFQVQVPDANLLAELAGRSENRWFTSGAIEQMLSVGDVTRALIEGVHPDSGLGVQDLSPTVPFLLGKCARCQRTDSGLVRIGVTGHRDLIDTAELRNHVTQLMLQYCRKNPRRSVEVLSPLADGADQLVAQIALDHGMRLIAPLPLPLGLYLDDFDKEGKQRALNLLDQCKEWFSMPLAEGLTFEAISNHGNARNRMYEAVGRYVADQSDLLLALWDGQTIGKQGGTGEIVSYARNTHAGNHDFRLEHIPVLRTNH